MTSKSISVGKASQAASQMSQTETASQSIINPEKIAKLLQQYIILSEKQTTLKNDLSELRQYLFKQFAPRATEFKNHKFCMRDKTIHYYEFKKYENLTAKHIKAGLQTYLSLLQPSSQTAMSKVSGASSADFDIDTALEHIMGSRKLSTGQAFQIRNK